MNFIKQHLYLVLCALCILLLGGFYLYQRNKPEAVIQINENGKVLSTTEGSFLTNSPKSTETSRTIKVYITGAVVSPGVYEVQEGARVDDVLQLAGGQTEEADLLRLNLAAYVSDAQQIIVPTVGEDSVLLETESVSTAESGLVNINTADKALLETLPGIGPVIAGNIIEYRTQNGFFKSIEDIMNVNRIGEGIFANIKGLITVD